VANSDLPLQPQVTSFFFKLRLNCRIGIRQPAWGGKFKFATEFEELFDQLHNLPKQMQIISVNN
jgi:hypothetical protein